MTLYRWISHLTVLGIVVLALLIARTQNQLLEKSTVVAALDQTAEPMQEMSLRAAPDNLLARAQADDRIEPLANAFTLSSMRPLVQLMTYTVQAGDTPSSIAAQFKLKPETILWGHPNLSADSGSLQVGQVLNILPVDGVLHTVTPTDTLESIQQMHSATLEDIIALADNRFNPHGPYHIQAGEQVIVPHGIGGTEWQAPGPRLVAGQGRYSPGYYKGPLANTGTSRFIWPVSSRSLSQEYWAAHPAIDIPLPPGTSIVAADSGTVIFSGWDDSGYGNLIIVDHGNGYWTYYAHNRELLVQAGDGVTQGQMIALSGNTGRSTGPHLDFRIRLNGGAFLDPLSVLP
ncbi:Murein DD-endopeptidase MepM [Thermoflexales bacterium]|nr:Murein DD-endopeptidase MepM [Thermoflexales bacterium]